MKNFSRVIIVSLVRGGVWHGAEGICGDAGECSSDGHASHPVSVDHS